MKPKVTFTPSDSDLALLEREVKARQCLSVPVLVKEIVNTWCVEQRTKTRLTMPVHHYTMRAMDDYTEVE